VEGVILQVRWQPASCVGETSAAVRMFSVNQAQPNEGLHTTRGEQSLTAPASA
jgi:hypothetical protein